MAQCVSISETGAVTFVPDTPPAECTAYVLLDATDHQLMVATYEISPEEVAEVFGWGFGVVLLFWSLGFAVGVAKSVIARA